jgi:hypothetical protein
MPDLNDYERLREGENQRTNKIEATKKQIAEMESQASLHKSQKNTVGYEAAKKGVKDLKKELYRLEHGDD